VRTVERTKKGSGCTGTRRVTGGSVADGSAESTETDAQADLLCARSPGVHEQPKPGAKTTRKGRVLVASTRC
jgi:hypothetical protein